MTEASEEQLATIDSHLLALEPQYRERVWGGQRLRPADPPVGEAWIAFDRSRVSGGRLDGLTLQQLSIDHGPELVGTLVWERFGPHFPLLIKLLDCADWLSVQVHPNDEQARRMVGPGEFGKTEAWYFLATEPDARNLVGVKPGVGREELATAIRDGRILEVANPLPVHEGEALLIPAGTLHALGPGILLYEVQQASDTTYRVYDWDRPASAGRELHIAQSIEVTQPVGPTELRHARVSGETGEARAVDCQYFALDLLRVSPSGGPLESDTGGRSFHVVTVTEGAAEIHCGSERLSLGRFETALVVGSAGAYQVLSPDGPVALLRAAVPG